MLYFWSLFTLTQSVLITHFCREFSFVAITRFFGGGTLGQNLLVGGTQTFLRTGQPVVLFKQSPDVINGAFKVKQSSWPRVAHPKSLVEINVLSFLPGCYYTFLSLCWGWVMIWNWIDSSMFIWKGLIWKGLKTRSVFICFTPYSSRKDWALIYLLVPTKIGKNFSQLHRT